MQDMGVPVRRFAMATALVVWAAAGVPMSAQESETERREQTITVTGSYIIGSPEDGPLPVDVFSAVDLEKAGVDSPLDFIKSLPSVGGVNGDSNIFAAGTEQGVGSINLRGLGRERTLVLFNGRRSVVTPGGGSADTQLIPMFALSRVEVLKDGAASTYGSDAIAGVVNFITRSDFDGVSVSGGHNFVDGSDGEYDISLLAGKNFSRGNVMFGAGYQHRSELGANEREFTKRPYAENPTGFSALSNPALYIPRLGAITQGNAGTALGVGVDGNLLNACDELGGIDGIYPVSATSVLPACRYNYVPFVNLVENEDRYQIYAQATYDISDSLMLRAEALYASTVADSITYSPSYPPVQGPQGPGSTGVFQVPRSNPGFSDFLSQTFSPGSPAYLAGYASMFLGRPFASGGNPLDSKGASRGGIDNEAMRVSIGLEKDFNSSVNAQLYTTYSRSERTAFAPDIISGRFQDALEGFGGSNCTGTVPGQNGCLYFNPFINSAASNPALGLGNPAFIAGNENNREVIEWFSSTSGATGVEEQFIVDFVLSGQAPVPAFDGLTLGYAVGAQYRDSKYVYNPMNDFSDPSVIPCSTEGDMSCLDDPYDSNFPTGPFTFLGQYPSSRQNQDVVAFFAEGNLDIWSNVNLTVAARYEDYGGSVGSTFNPKLSARWQINDMFALRGTVGSAFRGPLPDDLTEAGATGVAAFTAAGGAFRATQYGGNPDLKPETAITSNLGVIFQKGNLDLSVDYWIYDFEGRFTDLPFQAIANAVVGGPGAGTRLVDCGSPFADFIIFQGGCQQGITTAADISRVQTKTVNGPDMKTSGVDFSGSYRTNLGDVNIVLGGAATYINEFEISDFVYEGLTFSSGYDAAGYANYDRAPGTVSRWRANGYAHAELHEYDFGYAVRFTSGVTDNRCLANTPCFVTPEFGPTDFGRKVKDYVQHDVFISRTFEMNGSDVMVRLGIENLLDKDPAAARLVLGYDPYFGSPLGRVIKLSSRLSF